MLKKGRPQERLPKVELCTHRSRPLVSYKGVHKLQMFWTESKPPKSRNFHITRILAWKSHFSFWFCLVKSNSWAFLYHFLFACTHSFLLCNYSHGFIGGGTILKFRHQAKKFFCLPGLLAGILFYLLIICHFITFAQFDSPPPVLQLKKKSFNDPTNVL